MRWSCTIRARFFDKKAGVYRKLAPQAKGNRRVVTKQKRIVPNARAAAFVKECKAAAMCKPPERLLAGNLRFSGTLYYATPLSDLDPGLIWDALQGIVYENDRQIVEVVSLVKKIDRDDPRAEVWLEEVTEGAYVMPSSKTPRGKCSRCLCKNVEIVHKSKRIRLCAPCFDKVYPGLLPVAEERKPTPDCDGQTELF